MTISSVAAQLGGYRSSAAYIASKSAVLGLTKALARPSGEATLNASDGDMSGSSRQGGYGDDTGQAMSGSGVEGGNRNDPRTGTTANQTGSNRPSDLDRMQGRPSEVSDDDCMEDGSSRSGGSDLDR